jgi:hypothetical protein
MTIDKIYFDLGLTQFAQAMAILLQVSEVSFRPQWALQCSRVSQCALALIASTHAGAINFQSKGFFGIGRQERGLQISWQT